mgnify:CR=1 FL=1|jgi:hypothetical protein
MNTIKVGDLVETDIVFDPYFSQIHVKYGYNLTSPPSTELHNDYAPFIKWVFKVIEIQDGSVIICHEYERFSIKTPNANYSSIHGYYYYRRNSIVCSSVHTDNVKIFTGKLCHKRQFVCQQQCHLGFIKSK